MDMKKHIYNIALLACTFFLGITCCFAQPEVTFVGGDVDNGNTIIVQARVKNFKDLRSITLRAQWDASLLEFVQVVSTNPVFGSDLNVSNPASTPNEVRVIWSTVDSLTVPDNDVLFSFELRAISTTPTRTFIELGTQPLNPRNLVVVTNNGVAVNFRPPNSINGVIDMNGFQSGDASIYIDDVEANQNEQFCFDIRLSSAQDFWAVQDLFLNWDPTILEVVSISGVLGSFSYTFNQAMQANGQIGIVMTGNTNVGVTSLDTAFVRVCANVLGNCDQTSPLDLTAGPDFLVANSSAQELPTIVEDGIFTINCNPCDLDVNILQEISCNGEDDGILLLTRTGCNNVTSILWSDGLGTTDQVSNVGPGNYSVSVTHSGGTSVLDNIRVSEPPAITASAVITKATNGSDGAINLTASGGSGNLTYQWDDPSSSVTQDISGLSPRSYNVVVTDGSNCSEEFGPFVVGSLFTISENISDITCFGDTDGSITLTITGGAEPFDYEWSCSSQNSNSINNLPAGFCTVTVTDGAGCVVERTYEVDGPDAPLAVTTNVVDDSGSGDGSITLNISGGYGNETINWSGGLGSANPLTNIFGGNYSVTVTDQGGCSVIINDIEVDGFSVTGQPIGVTCFGDNNGGIDITVNGGSGNFSYDYSCDGTVDANGDISGASPGSCTVTVTDIDLNRITSATFDIPGPTEALVVSIPTNQIECTNGQDGSATAVVVGGVEPYSFAWSPNISDTDATANNLGQGTITVLVTDNGGCQVMAQAVVRPCSVGDECFEAMQVITPNNDGANDLFIINCAETLDTKLRIFTRWGEEVITYDNYQNEWNGVDDSGTRVSEDNYLWVLEVDYGQGVKEVYNGAVTVLYDLR